MDEQSVLKRARDALDSSAGSLSPDMLSPPTSKHKLNPATVEFADKFVAMLMYDNRVSDALTDLLLVPLYKKLDERENTIVSLVERVKVLENLTANLETKLAETVAKNDELEQYGRRNWVRRKHLRLKMRIRTN